jgi:lipopolysaccharide export system permease protein
MNIFQRSLMREFTSIGIGVCGVLIAIIVTRQFTLLLGRAARGNVEPEAVTALLGFGLLSYLPVVLCLALFISVLLALTRSNRDSEMQVWFASGQSLSAWIGPVLRFGIPIAIMTAALSLFLTPWSLRQSAEYQRLLQSKDEVSRMTPGTFFESRSSQRVAFVDTTSDSKEVINNVFVEARHGDRTSVVVAETGTQQMAANGDRFLVLQKGRQYDGVPGTPEYRIVDFDRTLMRIEAKEAKAEAPSSKALATLDLLIQPTPGNIAELHWRIALPISGILLALFAVPLSFVNPRSGRSWNLVLAILVFTLYYNLLNIFQVRTAQGSIPLWLGLWPVHIGMLLILLILFFRHLFSFRWLAFGRG